MARYGSGADLARELGISRQAVHAAEKAERISRAANGKFDLDAARIQYGLHTNAEQQRRALAKQGAGATVATAEPMTTSDWRTARERAEAERALIEVAKLKGELAATDAIQAAARRAAYAIVGALEQLPDRVAAECGADEPQRRRIRQVLQREVDQARREVAAALKVETQ